MTEVPNDFIIPDYIELVGSSEATTSSHMSKIQPSNDGFIESPSSVLHLSLCETSSEKSSIMTSSLNGKTWNDAQSSLPDSKSRPLPSVNEALGQKPPYYNMQNELEDIEVNISVNTREAGKRPSYVEVPSPQTSPEINSYSKVNSDTDHYDKLAPVQSLDVSKVNFTSSQVQADVANRKCVILSVLCIIVGLGIALAAMLTAVLVAKDQTDHSMDARMTSLRKFQDEMNAKVLDTVKAMCSSSEKASDLTVVYANSCFCLYRKKLSWKDAKDFCLAKGNGVHLAEIYSKEENDFLMPILQAAGTDLGIWLGGSDLDKEGEWVWNYTGKPIELFEPSQWLPNQPSSTSHIGRREDCLDVYNWNSPVYKWNDNACGDVQPFLCKSASYQSRCFC